MKTKRLEVPLEIRATTENSLEGYGSVFGNVDSYGDIVAKGAFSDSLKAHSEKGTAPAMLWQHNPDWPIGKWTEIREDDRGLYLKGEFADTQQGRDTRALARMGAITGMSIGFMTKGADMDRESGVRTIKQADLWEVSLVTFPANDAARVIEARAVEIETMEVHEIERVLRDAGMSRRESKTVISRLMSLGSLRDAEDHREAAELAAKLKSLRDILRG